MLSVRRSAERESLCGHGYGIMYGYRAFMLGVTSDLALYVDGSKATTTETKSYPERGMEVSCQFTPHTSLANITIK